MLASGTLKPSGLVAVGAQVSGRDHPRSRSPLGQKVGPADLIAEIDAALTNSRTNLRSAQGHALDSARASSARKKEATLAQERGGLARQKLTYGPRTHSSRGRPTRSAGARTLRRREAQIARQLDASIAEAEVSVPTARVNLDYTRITAPIDGTVLAHRRPGGADPQRHPVDPDHRRARRSRAP